MTADRRVALALAAAVLAGQWACDCPEPEDYHVVLLPPAEGEPDDAFYALACARECASLPCEPDPVVLDDGQEVPALLCTSNPDCVAGRRPAGFEGPTAGSWLARAACLEAASIRAFRELARDLRSLGAPADLAEDAERAARDERRHARVVARLARRGGARIPRVPEATSPPPTLLELAKRNAVEGCVREAYGAAEARWQALHATDPAVRRAMGGIAPDEASHAALAVRIDAWARPRLGPRAEAVESARGAAIRQLLAELRTDGVPSLGLPGRRAGTALARTLFAVLS